MVEGWPRAAAAREASARAAAARAALAGIGPGGIVGRGCSLDSAYLRRFDASPSFGFNSNTLRRVCGEQHPNQKIRRCYQGFQSSARAKSEGTASLHYRAYAFLSKQQWQLAAADYGAIIKTVPKDEAALEKRAYVYEKLGRQTGDRRLHHLDGKKTE